MSDDEALLVSASTSQIVVEGVVSVTRVGEMEKLKYQVVLRVKQTRGKIVLLLLLQQELFPFTV